MSYQITLQPSGHRFSVAEGERILTAGLAAHLRMPYGCRMGTCRSCRGKVESGDIDLGDAHPTYLPQSQRDEGYALLCQATARSDLVISLQELPQLTEPREAPVIVKNLTRHAEDVMLVTLRVPLHHNMRYAAGQYVDLLLEGGMKRSYSIANPPVDGTVDLDFHIRRLPGGAFTEKLFSEMKPREKLRIEGPLGTFFLRDSEKPALLIASGTGYAPIRAILLHSLPQRTGRKMVLYWGGRRRRDIYMFEEAMGLAEQYADFTFVPVLSEPEADDNWHGRSGFVHNVAMQDVPDMSSWQAYASGTPAMVEAARAEFSTICALPQDQFFADSFITQAELAAVANG